MKLCLYSRMRHYLLTDVFHLEKYSHPNIKLSFVTDATFNQNFHMDITLSFQTKLNFFIKKINLERTHVSPNFHEKSTQFSHRMAAINFQTFDFSPQLSAIGSGFSAQFSRNTRTLFFFLVFSTITRHNRRR